MSMANMHLVTGYGGSEHIKAEDQGAFNAALVGAGQYVFNNGSQFAATVITNNQIRIADGDILMQGRHIRLNEGSYVDLTIENGSQGYKRNDLIVARYTKNASTGVEEANLVVIKGTAAADAAADPEYTSGDIINDHVLQNDMPLYRVPLDGLTVGSLVPLFETIDSVLAANRRSTLTSATISTTWSGSAAPYSQTISIEGVEESSVVEISLPSTATAAQVKAFQKLCLQDGGQAFGSITLKAFGTKNTVSIPVNVIIRRDL